VLGTDVGKELDAEFHGASVSWRARPRHAGGARPLRAPKVGSGDKTLEQGHRACHIVQCIIER
jgi:hypothetical protein